MKPLRRVLKTDQAFDVQQSWVQGCRVLTRRSKAVPRRSAPAVVLVGGTALSGRYLLPTAVALASRVPVWVPDLPGRGASEAPSATMEVQEHANFLVSWMRAVGMERAAVLGNSMGCQIAVEVAVRHPDRLSHLVLQGPTPDVRTRSVVRHLVRLARDGIHEPTSLGPLELVDWLRAGPRHGVHQGRATLRHRIEERLPAVRCPALVVRGSKDPVVPQDWAREVTQMLPDGELRVVPGAGHSLVYSHALELARITEGFLTQPATA
jgi:2-hydroxy-6-oxonona-2,4-dienedioate hydrolase